MQRSCALQAQAPRINLDEWPRYNPPMDQIIFRYPGQIFVGIATRKTDGTLNHQGFVLLNAIPDRGSMLFDRQVSEVLTEEMMLKDLARRAAVEKMEAVAVLGGKCEAHQ